MLEGTQLNVRPIAARLHAATLGDVLQARRLATTAVRMRPVA
jgi:hypothetical protein